MIVVINSQGGLVSIQDEDLFQGSTKLNKIDLVAPFADNVVWKANFEMPDGTIKPEDLDGYLLTPSMRIFKDLSVWKLDVTFPITQDYGIVTMQLRGYIGETVVCTTSIKLPIQKGVPYDSDYTEITDKEQLLKLIEDIRALTNTKVDRVNYNYKLAENITANSVGIYYVYDYDTETYKNVTLPQGYKSGTEYYELLNTSRVTNTKDGLFLEYVDNLNNQSVKLKVTADGVTINDKQIVVFDDLKAENISFDNSISELNAENVQDAIDEIKTNQDIVNTDLKNTVDGIVNNVIKIGTENNSFSTKGSVLPESEDGSHVAIGNNAEVRTGGSAVVIGDGASAMGGTTAVGVNSRTDDMNATAVGANASAGMSGTAVGDGANAGNNGVALGKSSSAVGSSVALGRGAAANKPLAVQLGIGTNDEGGSLKFRNYRIVDTDGKVYTNDGTGSAIDMQIVASKKFVTDLFESVSGTALTLQIVDVLPTEDIKKNVIYLVSVENAEGNNYYEEYLYINDRWELIGTTQINLTEYVKNTDYATVSKAGVVKIGNTINGIAIDEVGTIYLQPASKGNIDKKTSYQPITPGRLDYAIKIGLTTNTETLTEEEKAAAQEWLGVSGSGGVSEEEFNKLVNNETSIRANSVTKSFLAGSPINSSAEYAIQIGYSSRAGFCGVGIGYQAEGVGATSVGLGYRAKATNNNNIQLGNGTNTKSNTLQIFNDNIYNHNTHTLTVQNIQLNGVDLGSQLVGLNTALEAILGV